MFLQSHQAGPPTRKDVPQVTAAVLVEVPPLWGPSWGRWRPGQTTLCRSPNDSLGPSLQLRFSRESPRSDSKHSLKPRCPRHCTDFILRSSPKNSKHPHRLCPTSFREKQRKSLSFSFHSCACPSFQASKRRVFVMEMRPVLWQDVDRQEEDSREKPTSSRCAEVARARSLLTECPGSQHPGLSRK